MRHQFPSFLSVFLSVSEVLCYSAVQKYWTFPVSTAFSYLSELDQLGSPVSLDQ